MITYELVSLPQSIKTPSQKYWEGKNPLTNKSPVVTGRPRDLNIDRHFFPL
jgi:hypothetical protein